MTKRSSARLIIVDAEDQTFWAMPGGGLDVGKRTNAVERYFVAKSNPNDLDFSGWQPEELETITKTAWLSRDDISALKDPVYPENIVNLVRISAGQE